MNHLHHAKGASSVLCRRFIRDNLDVALIQEPWFNKSRILGISTHKRKLIYDSTQTAPRAAILIQENIKFIPVVEFINRDIVAIQLEVPTTRGKTEIIVASAYFPGDSVEVPPIEVAALIQHCKLRNKQLIIGCDANAHHTVWGSTDINVRGEYLFEYLISNNINICNQGTESTFVNFLREEVLDLTLCTSKLSDMIENWHVSSEQSLSDHKHIMFNFNSGDLLKEQFRDPRKTNWDKFHSTLLKSDLMTENSIFTTEELEKVSSTFSSKITAAFEETCPLNRKTLSKDASWWNNKLEKLRKQTRKLFNRAKITSDWTDYKKSLTEYNREIRKSKRWDWKRTCEQVEQVPVVTRLHKALSKDHSNGLGSLKNKNGQFTTNSRESLSIMMETHFPGSIQTTSDNAQDFTAAPSSSMRNEDRAQEIASVIFTKSRVEWAVDSLKPFKSPGSDGIYPVLLQKKQGYHCSSSDRDV